MEFVLTYFSNKNTGNSKATYQISIDQVEVNTMHRSVINFFSSKRVNEKKEFAINPKKCELVDALFFQAYCTPIKMRFFPQRAIIGPADVFGFYEQMYNKLPIEYRQNEYKLGEIKREFEDKEATEVKKRTIASLRNLLGVEMVEDTYFELPYDNNLKTDVLRKYYYKQSHGVEEFLITPHLPFSQFCAPTLSGTNNPAINLPYFWCRGRECFKNNLAAQLLSEQQDWKGYSLYHLTEIMGYTKIHRTMAGNEPDDDVRMFIPMANSVLKKFKRLKCRTCGHLLFTSRTPNGFNRANYYRCENAACPECNKEVYLNYCYKCKKGLIDSRDTKQCPNRLYVCRECLSCCNDDFFENIAQKYTVKNQPVPNWLSSKLHTGHNDKHVYYCPDCGQKLGCYKDEHSNNHYRCNNCNKEYSQYYHQ